MIDIYTLPGFLCPAFVHSIRTSMRLMTPEAYQCEISPVTKVYDARETTPILPNEIVLWQLACVRKYPWRQRTRYATLHTQNLHHFFRHGEKMPRCQRTAWQSCQVVVMSILIKFSCLTSSVNRCQLANPWRIHNDRASIRQSTLFYPFYANYYYY
jgi:hypothetical protein